MTPQWHKQVAEATARMAAALTVDALPARKVRRLAAMALTWWESPWSDRDRDLGRGISCLMGRDVPRPKRRP